MTDAPKVPSNIRWMSIEEAREMYPDPSAVSLSSPRDFVEEALADGLIPDGDLRSTHERNYVPVSQQADRAKAWVDDALITLGLMAFMEEIDSWERRHDKRLDALNENFPKEYDRIRNALWDARENVRQLDWN